MGRFIPCEAALRHGIPLDVVLPFPRFAEDFPEGSERNTYERLLSAAASITCLPWDQRSNGAYLAGGLWLVAERDLLVAIWNGKKAPDFLSRISGYLDVLGPNPRGPENPLADRAYMLRRALLFRSILERDTQIDLSRHNAVDEGVVRAFLRVPFYNHGVRSMGAVVQMSALAGRARFERSSLPEAHQLELHVKAEKFLDLVVSDAS